LPWAIDDEITTRVKNLDVHPTGSLWGKGDPSGHGEALSYDRKAAAEHPDLAGGLEKFGLSQARRALRLNVREMSWDIDGDALWLEFVLTSGAFATSVIREIADIE
jgi:tRNA pseudouridine13 synthase